MRYSSLQIFVILRNCWILAVCRCSYNMLQSARYNFCPWCSNMRRFFWGKKPWWFVSVENPWWFSEVTHEESLSASTPSKGQFLEWFQGENSADLSCFLLDTTWPWAIPTQEFSWLRLSWFWVAEHLKISEDIWRYLKISEDSNDSSIFQVLLTRQWHFPSRMALWNRWGNFM